MPALSHVSDPPARAFWCDILCFERFDDVVAACVTEASARAELTRRAASPALTRAAEDLAGRAGGGVHALTNVALALAFLEGRRSSAVLDAAAGFVSAVAIEEFRTRGGGVRRFPLALRLFEEAPESLLAIELWDQWHARRGAWYRLAPELLPRLDVATTPWAAVAVAALAVERMRPGSRCGGFEQPVVFGGSEDDVIIGLREWPQRQAVKVAEGVVTGECPSWTLLRVYDGGQRLDVTDRLADRGADLATAMLRVVRPDVGRFELVLNELTDAVLDRFLARITRDDEVFPLVEITAEVPWDARHRELVVRGRPGATAAWPVAALRRSGPFAANWRTVRSVKLHFEGAHKIEVHFPLPGRHVALSYSDVDRDKHITRRFAALLNRELDLEVAPKARAGSRLPGASPERAPRPRSSAWWSRILAAKHDRPAAWVEDGVRALVADGVVRCAEVGLIRCGDPYLPREDSEERWAECNGELEVGLEVVDGEDPLRAEDDGGCECSTCGFRWRPRGQGVPLDLRLKLAIVHERAWERVMEEAAHYGAVDVEPGRSGVASVRLADTRAFIAYEPLLAEEDRLSEAFGRLPVARIAAPFGERPGGDLVRLAQVLAGDDVLGPAWGRPVARYREPRPVLGAMVIAAPTAMVIELLGPKSVRVCGRPVPKHAPSVQRLARLLALADLRAGERAKHDARSLLALAKANGICAATDGESHIHVLVSRGRDGVTEATGVEGQGEAAFVTDGGYGLGEGWEIRQVG